MRKEKGDEKGKEKRKGGETPQLIMQPSKVSLGAEFLEEKEYA